MSSAHLRVTHAGPLVSVQDAGRFRQLRYGVSPSGPMDRAAHAIANAALGYPEDATAIEVSLGGLVLECREGAVTFAIAGGAFSVNCGGKASASWGVHTLHEGQKLTIRGGSWGSWCYVAFAGNLSSQDWLGSTATHSMTKFGGGLLQSGQTLEITDAKVLADRVGDLPCPAFAHPDGTVHVVVGPQDQHFPQASIETFLNTAYRLTDKFDRMGLRLDGPILELSEALSIPSEPIVRGSVQVSGDGAPTILLSDHQTMGGYPKVATVVSCDLDRLCQMRASDRVKFVAVTPEQAIQLTRAEATRRRDYMDELSLPRTSLTERLLSENLVSGVINATDR
ncbi:biotin-dependent carboxyltransferase family protein [uncultured Litoreibacter sp.]|uniref:5-oxoprolinase subunit C family protein n=1 Tax=uncultured Litoreibacter sp. TaxID=1392394 RepID=UPI002609AA75|nr:biotin-dependent carboxyltransferase family protein [uncultured Litoreibacter sp.]